MIAALPVAPEEARVFEAVNRRIVSRNKAIKEQRLEPAFVRMWDGDYNFRGIIKREIESSYQWLDNEAGTAQVDLPMDFYLSRWLAEVQTDGSPIAWWAKDKTNPTQRQTSNIHLTADKDGARWSGRVEELKVIKDRSGKKFLRIIAVHDYAELLHIRCWSNPWTPAQLQFPRAMPIWAQSRWAGRFLLWANLFRLETGIWSIPSLPDDPTSLESWGSHLDIRSSNWTQVVKPDPGILDNRYKPDRSMSTFIAARFESLHEIMAPVCEEAELSWTCRRFLKHPDTVGLSGSAYEAKVKELIASGEIDGVVWDFPPWWRTDKNPTDPKDTASKSGPANLRHGCLVWDLEDKSAWNTGTSFFGSLFSGMVHTVVDPVISALRPDENVDVYGEVGKPGDVISSGRAKAKLGNRTKSALQSGSSREYDESRTIADPNDIPDKLLDDYYKPGWFRTNPAAPGVVYRESETTGIQASEFTWRPPVAGQYVGGGRSMAGVNEGMSASIQGIGAAISTIGIPWLAGAGDIAKIVDTLAYPFYRDTVMAWGKWRDVPRIRQMGKFHYKEDLADKAESGNPLTFFFAMRHKQHETRERTTTVLEVVDGAPWRIGQDADSHFFLGDRVGAAPEGIRPGRINVERVSEVTLSWSRTETPNWRLVLGQREFADPLLQAFAKLDKVSNNIQKIYAI